MVLPRFVKRTKMKEKRKNSDSKEPGTEQDYFIENSHNNMPISGPLEGENLCVIGGGFVGTVTAAGFASFGHRVVCVEKDHAKLSVLQAGRVPFYEKGLEDLIKAGLTSGRLNFTDDTAAAIEGRRAIFITVGTPSDDGGRTDLTALQEILGVISPLIRPGQILVLKSTVPIGTAARLRDFLKQNGCGDKDIQLVNNPEFLREGSAVFDFFNPDRIVLGGQSPKAIETINHIYRMGMTKPVPVMTTNNETAEMIKYASNAFLATKIGFANELARLCDNVGVNVMDVARAMGMDGRIGQEFLNPGPGWGGSCLPKDLSELKGLAETRGVPLLISDAVLKANSIQHDYVIRKMKKLLGELGRKRIGILGLSFKADTSDMRNSPTVPIIKRLISEGAEVTAYDPAAIEEASRLLQDIKFADSAMAVARDADCILILTEWSEFQLLDWKEAGSIMRQKNIVDTRNILAPELLRRHGFNYVSMGQN
jgi:UDPglucose 6-dehydrogenase